MARKPPDYEWFGFNEEQRRILDLIDFIGNNGWARTSQTETMMPKLLAEWAATGASFADVDRAMSLVGYRKGALHQLSRWESKRTTGRLGP